jgi:uncharacterized repeat protein (TIGR03803 family)
MMAVIVAAAFVMAILAARPAQAQAYKEKVLHSFAGGTRGANPFGLIRDTQGNLYGTTNLGGYLNCPGEQGNGCGVVFKLSATDKETVLHRFMGGTDGELPSAGVIRDAQGNLYGTTYAGGVAGCLQYYGCGVVFRMDTSGKETVLHSFCPEYPNCPDGASPSAGVIQDAQENFYGTTAEGGNSGCFAGYGCGIVFKFSKAGKESVLHSFTGGADGATPYAGVILDAKGNLYGTTYYGGRGKCNDGFGTGCGVVFKLGTTGKETVLHSFTGGTDGAYPDAGVIQDAMGNLYGTTKEGGDLSGCDGLGCGVVFKLSTAGKETVLHSFTGRTDGANPDAGVIQDAKGNLYGITPSGGDLSCGNGSGCGVVFKLGTTGKETVLHSFTGGTGGAHPDAGVIQDAIGNLYGTTYAGGDSSCGYQGGGCGVVFELTPTN